MYQKAIPFDPLEQENLFYSDVLPFVSAVLIYDPSITLKKVLQHPIKPGIKLFYLDKKERCIELWKLFSENDLKVDAKSQSIKIRELVTAPLTERPINIPKNDRISGM